MAKAKTTAFYCKECGNESSKWSGQCPACGAWNSLVEAPKESCSPVRGRLTGVNAPVPVREVNSASEDRTKCGNAELDRVLGGGIVPGSLVLIGGDPGIGKSTLLMQTCGQLSKKDIKILYISGEESLKQIKLRADRLETDCGSVLLLCETDVARIQAAIDDVKPDVVVVDSVQTMYVENVSGAPGSVTQVREAANVFMTIAKGMGITVFLVGHVTREGSIAGPKILEHMVDTVLYFEGERSASYRILRAVKNRFGSTDEIGVFEMTQRGLKEVENPSEYMLTGRPLDVSGSVVFCCMEGTRPVLLEIQALVCRTSFGNARRSSNGVDYNRMNMLLAVLEKKLEVPLFELDAYINITGGMKVAEPAMDLGIAAAVISSLRNTPVHERTVFFGEIGLAGEVRGVSMTAQRLNEAARLGFTRCVMPAVSLEGIEVPKGIECIGIRHVGELVRVLRQQS